jgi:hypothetical protein
MTRFKLFIDFHQGSHRSIIAFVVFVFIVGAFACKTKNDDPLVVQENATTHKSNTGIPPVTDYDENPYFTIEYFYRGASPTTHVSPFERCTREGDYMVLSKKTDKEYSKPVLGIRIYYDHSIDAVNPDIDPKSFDAVQDEKALTPRIRHFENNEVWLAEINWDLDPEWRAIHIAQNIFGRLNEKRVAATAKFQLDIQDQKIDWAAWPKDGSVGGSNGGFEVCPP